MCPATAPTVANAHERNFPSFSLLAKPSCVAWEAAVGEDPIELRRSAPLADLNRIESPSRLFVVEEVLGRR